MTDVDGILAAALIIIYYVVAVVVEDDAILQHLGDAGPLVLVGSLQHLYAALGVGGYAASEESSAGAEAELCRAEGILYRAIGARLRDKASWRRGRILALGESVDAVVEQDDVDVDVSAVGMDEVVASDGQSVAVA